MQYTKKQLPQSFYLCWQNIKKRCNNKKAGNYKFYGGRGITYDKKWETIHGLQKICFQHGVKI